jgi:hypothetical protein
MTAAPTLQSSRRAGKLLAMIASVTARGGLQERRGRTGARRSLMALSGTPAKVGVMPHRSSVEEPGLLYIKDPGVVSSSPVSSSVFRPDRTIGQPP